MVYGKNIPPKKFVTDVRVIFFFFVRKTDPYMYLNTPIGYV